MSSLAGCFGDDEEEDVYDGPITLEVYYETTSGTIEEEIRNGAQISESGVEVVFDFARTKSQNGAIDTFWMIPGDGSSEQSVNAADSAEVRYTYMTHGLFTATLGATDLQGNSHSIDIVIRIDKRVTWDEMNTNQDQQMQIDVTPDCECPSPEYFAVDSTVSNPSGTIFNPGSAVTVTWHVNDTAEERQGTYTEQIGDGQSGSWQYNQYGLDTGIWTLTVSIDQGSDSIDISHIVTISYEEVESDPNPISGADE